MKIIFYIPHLTEVWTRFVALTTWGPIGHCELMFSDGQCFSSAPRVGVRFERIRLNNQWIPIDLPISPDEERALKLWCMQEVGCKYDYLGAITLSPNLGEKWFCSEICIAALNDCTPLPKLRECMSPNNLYYCCRCRYT